MNEDMAYYHGSIHTIFSLKITHLRQKYVIIDVNFGVSTENAAT